MLSIISLTPSIVASAVPPYLIATIKDFLKFGAFRERFYSERIYLQVLKTSREKNEEIRELLRAKGVTCRMF